jgi:hypothetical protein
MIDLIYILLTIGFFALMIVYVRWCEWLGSTDARREAGDGR